MSHKALVIPEVLLHICQYLDKQSKGRCSRVCKQFHSPALDVLWRSLDDLEPLIRTLPEDCFASANSTNLSFTRALVPSDWTRRFQFYADKILEIAYRERSSLISFVVLNHLAIYRPTLRILPRLRKFHCSANTSQGMLSTTFLLSPSVTDVIIHAEGDVSDNALVTFFGTLQQYAAGVRCFAFTHGRTPTFVAPVIASLTPLLSALEHVTSVAIPLSVINSQTLIRLASIPSLRSLFITASRQNIVESDRPGADIPPIMSQADSASSSFPALECLEISARLSMCINIISGLASPHVTSIRLSTLHLENNLQMTECISAIAATCPTLRKLSIEIREKHRSEPPFGITDEWYTLEPALLCPFLTHVSFICPAPLALSDDDLRRMCQAWTSLEFLSLNPRPSACSNANLPSDTNLTLSSLSIPVECCPRLKHLGLLIDAVVPTTPPRQVLSTTLSSLDLFYSRVSDIGSVATYLNTAYPAALCSKDDEMSNRILYITSVFGRNGSQDSTIAKWRQIDALLRNLRRIRADDTEQNSQLRTEVERSRARITELEAEVASLKAQLALGNPAGKSQSS